MRTRVLTWFLVGAFLSSPGAAVAQADPHTHSADATPHHPVTFAEALQLASDSHEARGLQRSEERLAAAREHTSALPDDLQIAVEGGVAVTPTTAFQGRVSVVQHFSTSALGDARRSVVTAEADSRAHERAFARLTQRVTAARAWSRLWVIERELALLESELEAAAQAISVAERGVALGELTQADSLDALAYREELRLLVLDLNAERTHAEHDLARMLELDDVALATAGDPPEMPLPSGAARAALVDRVRQDPEILALVSRAVAYRARAVEARAQNAARIGVGATLDRAAPEGIAVLLAGVLTLPTSQRGSREGALLEAEAEATAGRAETRARRRRVDFEDILHELDHSTETRAHVSERWVPALQRELEQRERLFRAGELTMIELFRARRATLTGRLREFTARGEELESRATFSEVFSALGGAQ